MPRSAATNTGSAPVRPWSLWEWPIDMYLTNLHPPSTTGAAAFIKTYSFTTRLINYRTNPYSWVAAGTYVAGSYKATSTCVHGSAVT